MLDDFALFSEFQIPMPGKQDALPSRRFQITGKGVHTIGIGASQILERKAPGLGGILEHGMD